MPKNPGKVPVAYAPNGQRITGTLDVVQARARGYVSKDANGKVEHVSDSYTQIWWDTQELLLSDAGETQYVDESDNVWPESQLTFRLEEPPPPEGI